MKTKIYSVLLACAALPLFSQVGINTSTPTATLDVNGTLKVRDTPVAASVSGYQILAQDNTTTEVFKMDPQLLIAASSVNTTVYAAKKTSDLALLTITGPGGFKALNFVAADRTIGNGSYFTDSDGSYTIQSTGVYAIGFAFKYSTGVVASLLSNGGIGIARTRSGVTTLIDSRMFSGILTLSVTDTSISSIYSFQAGDKINFGTIETGGLTLGLISSSIASFYIYKVSN